MGQHNQLLSISVENCTTVGLYAIWILHLASKCDWIPKGKFLCGEYLYFCNYKDLLNQNFPYFSSNTKLRSSWGPMAEIMEILSLIICPPRSWNLYGLDLRKYRTGACSLIMWDGLIKIQTNKREKSSQSYWDCCMVTHWRATNDFTEIDGRYFS